MSLISGWIFGSVSRVDAVASRVTVAAPPSPYLESGDSAYTNRHPAPSDVNRNAAKPSPSVTAMSRDGRGDIMSGDAERISHQPRLGAPKTDPARDLFHGAPAGAVAGAYGWQDMSAVIAQSPNPPRGLVHGAAQPSCVAVASSGEFPPEVFSLCRKNQDGSDFSPRRSPPVMRVQATKAGHESKPLFRAWAVGAFRMTAV